MYVCKRMGHGSKEYLVVVQLIRIFVKAVVAICFFSIRARQTKISVPYVKTIGLILALFALSMVSKGRERHSI